MASQLDQLTVAGLQQATQSQLEECSETSLLAWCLLVHMWCYTLLQQRMNWHLSFAHAPCRYHNSRWPFWCNVGCRQTHGEDDLEKILYLNVSLQCFVLFWRPLYTIMVKQVVDVFASSFIFDIFVSTSMSLAPRRSFVSYFRLILPYGQNVRCSMPVTELKPRNEDFNSTAHCIDGPPDPEDLCQCNGCPLHACCLCEAA